MSEIYCVEVPGAPDKTNRFLTYFGNEYAGINSVQFVPLNRAIRKVNGVLQGDKPQSMCRKMVDDAHAHAANGGAAYLASARVLKYLGPDKYEIAYEGKEVEVKHVEPEIPKAFLAQDGTWRKTPVNTFTKGGREWAFIFAHVHNGTAYPGRLNAKTKLETIQQLFDSQTPWHMDYVKTFPFADPSEIPAPPAPVVEREYTQAELDAVPPLDPKVFERMSVAEHKKRYLFDPLYQVAFDKMNDLEVQQRAQAAERQRKQDKDAELKKMREQFLKDEEDDRRKGGGGKGGKGSVGTIL